MSTYYFCIVGFKHNDTAELIYLNEKWIKFSDISMYILSLGIILGGLGIVYSFIGSKKLNKLSRFNNIDDEFYKMCCDLLRNIFDQYLDSFSNTRISLYEHSDGKFKLIGRYSNNPIFNKKGRDYYPDDEGFISMGWNNGKKYIKHLPDYNINPEEYLIRIKKHISFREEVLKNLNMKSRVYYVRSINNEDSRLPYGIVVIESTLHNAPKEADLDKSLILFEPYLKTLYKSMKSLK